MSRATNTNAFTSYSPFFSSGLLAQSTNPRLQRRGTFNSDISEPWDDELSDSYRSSSPGPADSLMDTDPDADANTDADADSAANTSLSRRSATPTPRSNGESLSISPNAPHSLASPLPTPTQQPRLRRRRSSLTQAATSPMNAIRGPARAAENALHLQKQLPVPSRARSGSVGADTTMSLYTGLDGTTTIVVGRMRSGSCSSVLSLPTPVSASHLVPSSSPSTSYSSASRYTNVSITRSRATGLTTISLHRPRRAVRRGVPVPVPALLAPPPTAPLPALPPTPAGHGPAKLRPANVNLSPTQAGAGVGVGSSPAASAGNTLKSPAARTSARARGLSVSSSALDGAENRIDEEMKEN